jgi:hypothetical protein
LLREDEVVRILGRRHHRRRLLTLALGGLLATMMLAGPAGSLTLVPPSGQVFFGVSDRGTTAEYREFREVVGKHPAVLQTFHPWGNSLHAALPRWQELRVRPMLHISTMDPNTLGELITPRSIALGSGDNYLLRLNQTFAKQQLPAYIRPLGEPNRCLNAYAAIDCSGASRGGDHSHQWYKQAFRRIAILIRGGGSIAKINARLAVTGLPPVSRQGGAEPDGLPAAPVAIIWSPLPGGSPPGPGTRPGRFWPGARYVDWVGTDFYSRNPLWRTLNRFYRKFASRRFGRKPFSLTEWAVAGEDDPRFIRQVFAWTHRRPRVRMLIYYRGFGEAGNSYRIGLYPRSLAALRQKLNQRRFPAFAPNHAEPPPPTGGASN